MSPHRIAFLDDFSSINYLPHFFIFNHQRAGASVNLCLEPLEFGALHSHRLGQFISVRLGNLIIRCRVNFIFFQALIAKKEVNFMRVADETGIRRLMPSEGYNHPILFGRPVILHDAPILRTCGYLTKGIEIAEIVLADALPFDDTFLEQVTRVVGGPAVFAVSPAKRQASGEAVVQKEIPAL